MTNKYCINSIINNLLLYYNHNTDNFSNDILLTEKILDISRKYGDVVVSDTIWEDVGMFTENGVFQNIQRCQTYFGFLTQVHTILNPITTQIPYQDIINNLHSNNDLYHKVQQKLEIIK